MLKKKIKNKKNEVSYLVKKINNSLFFIINKFKNINSKDFSKLRKNINVEKNKIIVFKKSILNIAFKKSIYKNKIKNNFNESNFIFFNNCIDNCEETLSKSVYSDYINKKKWLTPVIGILNNKIIKQKQIYELSLLPNKIIMISLFATILLLPLQKFINLILIIKQNKKFFMKGKKNV